jgi:hypothetical protein
VIDLGGNEDASAAVLQGDGKVVVAGIARLAFGLVRLQPGGTLDSTFGDGGVRTVAFPGGPSGALGLALQPDGGLVAAGAVGGGSTDIAIARVLGGSGPGGAGPGAGAAAGGRAPRCAGKAATIVGTSGRDRLRGTRRADVIVGLGGNDAVTALGGNDLVCGGPGRDLLKGGPGKDRWVRPATTACWAARASTSSRARPGAMP